VKTPVNLYDLAYLTIAPAAAAMIGYKMWRKGKYRESAPAMLGMRLNREDPSQWSNGCVWVHAVSVGEVIAARAMLPLLREYFAPLPILLTTHTETGQATARSLPAGMTDAVRYYPMDFSWVVQNYVDVYKPKIFIPMETELWPNALDIISRSGAHIFTLNGKISDKSFRSYQKIGSIIRRPLSRITAFCVQTERDKQRISALLGSGDNVHVTGNCKFDVDLPQLDAGAKAALANELQLRWPSRLIVAGSTHPGEEEIVLNAMREVWKQYPDIQLVLVPRHPERFSDVWSMLRQSGIPAIRISDNETSGAGHARIHLIDRMGILTRLYALAEVAIVAGSFTSGIGGHNILEPAAHGVPVIYGPDMKGQPDMARILSPEHGGTQSTPDQLGQSLNELLGDPDTARRNGMLGRDAFQSNQGSARRNMEIIAKYWEGRESK